MYSSPCIVNSKLGAVWWVGKCLNTAVLALCLMSKRLSWNLSNILYLVCLVYLILHILHSNH